MPTYDLYLPPRAFSRWRPSRHADDGERMPIHPMAAAWALFRLWIERARQRQALSELDGRMLQDIGVTPSDAAREYLKPFWR